LFSKADGNKKAVKHSPFHLFDFNLHKNDPRFAKVVSENFRRFCWRFRPKIRNGSS